MTASSHLAFLSSLFFPFLSLLSKPRFPPVCTRPAPRSKQASPPASQPASRASYPTYAVSPSSPNSCPARRLPRRSGFSTFLDLSAKETKRGPSPDLPRPLPPPCLCLPGLPASPVWPNESASGVHLNRDQASASRTIDVHDIGLAFVHHALTPFLHGGQSLRPLCFFRLSRSSRVVVTCSFLMFPLRSSSRVSPSS